MKMLSALASILAKKNNFWNLKYPFVFFSGGTEFFRQGEDIILDAQD